MNLTQPQPELSKEAFFRALTEAFPVIKEEIYDELWEDLSHLQVAVWARYTNTCIQKGDLSEVKRCFQFLESTITKVDSELKNALYVSYLEHIIMENDNHNQIAAQKLFAPHLLKEWRQLIDFLNGLK